MVPGGVPAEGQPRPSDLSLAGAEEGAGVPGVGASPSGQRAPLPKQRVGQEGAGLHRQRVRPQRAALAWHTHNAPCLPRHTTRLAYPDTQRTPGYLTHNAPLVTRHTTHSVLPDTQHTLVT